MVIVDNFFDNFKEIDKYLRGVPHVGVYNPEDDVLYPHINGNIPSDIRAEFKSKVELAIGRTISINYLFTRSSDATTPIPPHQAHTDKIMGTHMALVFFQDGPEGAGTSYVRHIETGLEGEPTTEEEWEVWNKDTNEYDKWEITELLEMKANRILVNIDTTSMHRAEPPEGFGTSIKDGRLVMICFYNLLPKRQVRFR